MKFRESKVTLNQRFVLEILLNFFQHRSNNPESRLLFRFVTNAAFGTERPAIFPDGRSGVEVWRELSVLGSVSPSDERYLKIKKHLQGKVNENIGEEGDHGVKSSVQEQWSNFSNFIEDDEQLIAFISDFEWSLNNENEAQIGKLAKKNLLAKNMVSSEEEAELIYPRLFHYVFKLLSQSGLKRLSKIELSEQITKPQLSSHDNEQIGLIKTLLNDLEDRVSNLEGKVSSNVKKIAALAADVGMLSRPDTAFDYRRKSLPTNPPALVQNGSLRRLKVAEIERLFAQNTWVSLQGVNGSGKSQLAALVCLKFENYWWLDLRSYNQDAEKVTLLIESFLETISDCAINHNRGIWLGRVTRSLPNKTVLVLNDLPRTGENSALDELLVTLAKVLITSEVRLLTTSNFNIHRTIIQSLGSSNLSEVHDFTFTNEEIKEYMLNFGLNVFVPNYIDLIANLSHRNPRLVSAIIYYLRSIDWEGNTMTLLGSLIKKEFSSEILDDAQRSISRYIVDEEARELLYRLSLIHWDFGKKEVDAVSYAGSRIRFPSEKFSSLVNVWIQKQHNDVFQISPLIHDIGESNLPQQTVRDVHVAIAESIISNGIITQLNGTRSITSFVRGGDYNGAGSVLLNIYQSAKTESQIKYLSRWGYLNYWSESEIPREMNVMVRAFIRHEQIRLYQAVGRDATVFHGQIKTFAEEESTSLSEKFAIRFLYLSDFQGNDFASYWYVLDDLFIDSQNIEEPFESLDKAETFTSVLWLTVQYLKSAEDIYQWLKFVTVVEETFDIEFFDDAAAQPAISLIASGIVNREHQKESASWVDVLSLLRSIRGYFKERSFEVLEAEVMKSIVLVQFEMNKDLNTAAEMTIEYAKSMSKEAAKYLLFENIGKLCYNNNEAPESAKWLLKALETECENQFNYVETLQYAAFAVSKSDSSKSVELCEHAVKIAQQKENFLESYYIQILGELATAYWLNLNTKECFDTFEDIVDRLLIMRSDHPDKEWIRLFRWTGHTLGYIVGIVCRETELKVTSDGEEYVKPYQGIFTFNTKDASDFYQPENDSVILAQMAIFSGGIDNMPKALYWSEKAFDLARKASSQKIFLMVSSVCNQYFLVNFKVEETLETSLLNSAVFTHQSGEHEDRISDFDKIDIAQIFDLKPSEKWNEAEDKTVIFAVIPLFIMVLTSQFENFSDKDERVHRFLYAIDDYLPKASDKDSWELILELCSRVLHRDITMNELVERGESFGNQERRNLQIICMLGWIYLTKEDENVVLQIINIFPYLLNTTFARKAIAELVLVPFIRNRCLSVLKETFVGSRQDLEAMESHIKSVEASNKDAVQLILRPVVEELELSIPGDRKEWLYSAVA